MLASLVCDSCRRTFLTEEPGAEMLQALKGACACGGRYRVATDRTPAAPSTSSDRPARSQPSDGDPLPRR